MAVGELQKFSNTFVSKAHRILRDFNATDHTPTVACCVVSHSRTRASCVADLHNAWDQFCKELVVASVIGGANTRSGISIPRSATISGLNDVMSTLRASYAPRTKPNFWEPHWSIASELIDSARRLEVVNLSNISAAVGSTSSVADELRHARNYVSHRKADTALKTINALSAYGAVAPLDIDSLLVSFVPSGVTLFEHWVTNLSVISAAACD